MVFANNGFCMKSYFTAARRVDSLFKLECSEVDKKNEKNDAVCVHGSYCSCYKLRRETFKCFSCCCGGNGDCYCCVGTETGTTPTPVAPPDGEATAVNTDTDGSEREGEEGDVDEDGGGLTACGRVVAHMRNKIGGYHSVD